MICPDVSSNLPNQGVFSYTIEMRNETFFDVSCVADGFIPSIHYASCERLAGQEGHDGRGVWKVLSGDSPLSYFLPPYRISCSDFSPFPSFASRIGDFSTLFSSDSVRVSKSAFTEFLVLLLLLLVFTRALWIDRMDLGRAGVLARALDVQDRHYAARENEDFTRVVELDTHSSDGSDEKSIGSKTGRTARFRWLSTKLSPSLGNLANMSLGLSAVMIEDLGPSSGMLLARIMLACNPLSAPFRSRVTTESSASGRSIAVLFLPFALTLFALALWVGFGFSEPKFVDDGLEESALSAKPGVGGSLLLSSSIQV